MTGKMQWVDCHCHSRRSFDGVNTIRELCRKAVKSNVNVLAITDHCEINGYEVGGYHDAIRRSFEETEKLKPVFEGELELLAGVEMGQPMENLSHVRDMFSIGTFDFVLGSLHNLPGMPDFYFLEYDHIDISELLKNYFEELCEMITCVDFDSVAHITYPLRYIVGDKKRWVNMRELRANMDEALRLTAEKGKALEINASGLRQNIGTTLPDLPVVKRFKKLGGELITIGTDAHSVTDMGKGIREAYEIARRADFHSIVYYKKRQPVEVFIG